MTVKLCSQNAAVIVPKLLCEYVPYDSRFSTLGPKHVADFMLRETFELLLQSAHSDDP
jgi:hypothetical protein